MGFLLSFSLDSPEELSESTNGTLFDISNHVDSCWGFRTFICLGFREKNGNKFTR
jgi:hypothetical protein